MASDAIKPSDVHPTHDVREEGILISDPVCQKCRASVHGSPDRLLAECAGTPTIKKNLTVRIAEYSPAGGPRVMIWVNDRNTQRDGYCLDGVPRNVAPAIVSALYVPENKAVSDVVAERLRQISGEGWSLEHDDEHSTGELAAAAACYAYGEELEASTGPIWPWNGGMPVKWPLDRRRELVKAGALIVAEIERLDRTTLTETSHDR